MSHTQGKLIAGDPSDALHPIRRVPSDTAPIGRVIADVGYSDTEEENTANARRLVAAWNACDGISTNTLEALRTPIKDISCIPGLVADIDALRAVNAELVEALKEARRWIGDGDMSDGMAREIWTPKYAAAVDMVDAALAKAKELKGTE